MTREADNVKAAISANPYVFIGGCPRSGTTLLQRMLDNHPDLAVANDTHFIPRALRKSAPELVNAALNGELIPLTDQLVSSVWEYHRFYRLGLSRTQFVAAAENTHSYQALVSRLFDQFALHRGKPLAGEKTPDYIREMPLLHGLFPQARLVHIVRDGRDVALSLKDWATPHKGPGRLTMWDVDPLAVAALWWNEFVEVTGDVDQMAGIIYLMKYEQLVDDAAEQLSGLCQFLGLSYSEKMSEFHAGKQPEPKSSQGLSAKSQWLPATKGLRDWRTQLSQEDIAVFEVLAGDALERLGYERSGKLPTARAADRARRAQTWWQAPGRKRRPKTQSVAVAGCSLDEAAADSESNGEGVSFRRNSSRKLSEEPTTNISDKVLIQRDRELVGLRWVLDPDRIRALIHEHAAAVGCDHDEIPAVQPTYVRYKSATSCLTRLQLPSGEPWGCAVGFRADATDKLDKASLFFRQHTGPMTGVVDKDRRVAIYRFPADPRLQQIAEIQHAITRHEFLRSLWHEPSPAGLPMSTKPWETTGFEVLSYKPMRRAVIRFDRQEMPPAVLRLYTRSDYDRVKRAHKQLAGAAWQPARRLGHSDRHCAIVTEWIPGTAVQQPIRAGDHRLAWAVGNQLAEIHARPQPKLPLVGDRELMAWLHQSVDAIVDLLPQLRQPLDRLAARIESDLTGSLPYLTLCHGDLHAGQVLQDQGELRIVDWDNACNAPVGVDLASFAVDILVHGLSNNDAGDTSAEEAVEWFLDGYRSAGGQVPENLASLYGLATLRDAVQPFRSRQTNWAEAVERIVELTTELISNPSAGQRGGQSAAPESHSGRVLRRRG